MSGPAVRYVASTYSYLWRRDLEPAIDDLAGAGFDAVEILAARPHVGLPMDAAGSRRLRLACEAAGVHVNSVVPSGVDVNLASVDPAMRAWSIDQFISAAQLAAELGAPYALVHPGRRHPLRPPPLDQLREWVCGGVSRVVEHAAAAGVHVLLENTPTGLFDTARDCASLVDEIGSEHLDLCYDVANGHMAEDSIVGLRVAAPRLRLVHLSDTTRQAWAHDPIGDGELDFARLAEQLADLGYDGGVVLETLQPDNSVDGFVRDLVRLRAAGWN